MIIRDNFVYIHVPRTAGTTAESIFIRDHGFTMTNGQHDSLVDIDEEYFSEKYIFGFVRNPFSSEYSYWRHSQKLRQWPDVTFEDWIKFRYFEDHGIEYLKSKYHFEDFHDRFLGIRHVLMRNPQAGFFCNMDGQCVASRIFKFEYLNESWLEVTDHLKLNMMHVEYTPHSEEYKSYYDDYLHDAVANARKYDLDLFGYTFDDNGQNDCPLDYNIGPIERGGYCFNRDFINL